MSEAKLSPVRIVEHARKNLVQCDSRGVPALRRIRRELSKELSCRRGLIVLTVVKSLLEFADVPKWFAYEILHHHDESMQQLKLATLRELGAGLSAWGEVDAFACYLSGPAWRDNKISDNAVQRWAKSRDRWWRRVAVVSTVPLNNTARGGSIDVQRTLGVCKLVVHDRDDMVIKGLSWALRELAKKAPSSVREFISSQESVIAARVKREVFNKLDTGLKNPRKKPRRR